MSFISALFTRPSTFLTNRCFRNITTKNEVVATIKRKTPRRPIPKVTSTLNENIQRCRLEDGSVLESFIPKRNGNLPEGSVDPKSGLTIVDNLRLPPLLKPLKPFQIQPKQLSETEIQQIRDLRLQDPKKHTRSFLAKKFGVSPFYISTIAPLKGPQFEVILKERAAQWDSYGWRRKAKMVDRIRRKELW